MVNLTSYIGKPYRLGGRGPDFYDCYGLVLAVYREIGIYLPEYMTSENTPDETETRVIDRLITGNSRSFVGLERPEPWAIVVFADGHFPEFVTHLGVIIDDPLRFIHARRNADVCTESLFSRLWMHRRRGLYRWNN